MHWLTDTYEQEECQNQFCIFNAVFDHIHYFALLLISFSEKDGDPGKPVRRETLQGATEGNCQDIQGWNG